MQERRFRPHISIMLPKKEIRESGDIELLNKIYDSIAELDDAYIRAYYIIRDAGDTFSADKLRNHKRTSLNPFKLYYAALYKAYQEMGVIARDE
jgi:hypothetical protein